MFKDRRVQTREGDGFREKFLLMYSNYAQNQYLAAYNLFCELAAMCTEDGSAPELNSLQDLAELFELFHFRYGLNQWDSDSLRLGVNDLGLFRLIGAQLMQPEPLPENEMPLETLLDVWQQQVQYLGA